MAGKKKELRGETVVQLDEHKASVSALYERERERESSECLLLQRSRLTLGTGGPWSS